MKLFKRKNPEEEILKVLKEIHSILEDEQSENKKLHWLLLSQDNDIRKLKEKNKDLKNMLKEREWKTKKD